MTHKNIFEQFGAFLLARPLAGGLEINDSGLRFVSAEGAALHTAGVRLPPGVMNEGRIEDREEFIRALRALRVQILGSKAKRRAPINVVVSLSSINVYTQVFKLPFIEGENLEKAVQLNIQMASPTGTAANIYTGWQSVRSQNEHNVNLEVVTAFLPRGVADELTAALRAGGFLPIALESRALSLARIIREKAAGVEPAQPLIAISADASGLDVMIIRAGHLHFDYFNSWKDLQGSEREITLEFFRTLIVREVNQVMNFYAAHWKDPVTQIVVAATGMKDQILAAIAENFDFKVSELMPLVSPPLTPEWYVALGGALRSLVPRRKDSEISLLGVSAQEEFQREQVQSFLGFWRVLVPASLAVLLAAFVAGWLFLNAFEKAIGPQARAAEQLPRPPELAALRLQAKDFNTGVAMLGSVNATREAKGRIFSVLAEIITRRSISVTRMKIGAPADLITLQGTAVSEDDIIAFKNELVVTPGFKDVELPVTAISQRQTDYVFSMIFRVSP